MNQITIFSPEEIPGCWPVDEFLKVYTGPLTGCKIITMGDSDDAENPDKTSVIVLRTYIENFEIGQKYIIGISFINFGQITTIDVLSFNDLGFHREMCVEHCRRMNWPLVPGISDFEKTYHAPFLFVGGYIKKENDQLVFYAESGDYGKEIITSDANAIATYVANLCLNNNQIEGEGKDFVEEMLTFLLQNKGENFFEQLIYYIYEKVEIRKQLPEAQHLAAFVTMKAFARTINEQVDFLQTLVMEVMNLGRVITVAATGWNIRHKDKDDEQY